MQVIFCNVVYVYKICEKKFGTAACMLGVVFMVRSESKYAQFMPTKSTLLHHSVSKIA